MLENRSAMHSNAYNSKRHKTDMCGIHMQQTIFFQHERICKNVICDAVLNVPCEHAQMHSYFTHATTFLSIHMMWNNRQIPIMCKEQPCTCIFHTTLAVSTEDLFAEVTLSLENVTHDLTPSNSVSTEILLMFYVSVVISFAIESRLHVSKTVFSLFSLNCPVQFNFKRCIVCHRGTQSVD